MKRSFLEILFWAPGVFKTSVTIHSFHPPLRGRKVWSYLPPPVGQFGIGGSLEPLETEHGNWLSDSQKSIRERKKNGDGSCPTLQPTVWGKHQGLRDGSPEPTKAARELSVNVFLISKLWWPR